MKTIVKVSASLLIASALIAAGCFSGAHTEPVATTTRPSEMSSAAPVLLSVHVDRPGPTIAPTFYGVMTEEINHSYDGGLYAELIQNRIFQNSQLDVGNRGGGGAGRRGARGATNPATAPAADGAATPAPPAPAANYLIHWSVVNSDGASGTISIDTNDPVNTKALAHSLKLDISQVGNNQRVGVANDGYWGIPVKPNTEYKASFYARVSPGITSPLTVAIESNDGKTTYASGTIPNISTSWHKYGLTLKTGAVQPTADTRFVISASKPGSVWLSLVSLFPPTFNNRPNGNRIDLMEKLIEMKPAFLRYPGGNYLEGRGLAERWAWKNTIGPLEDRLGHGNSAWRYRASDGMGMLEFLEWAEDMKAEPVLAVYSGFSLQGSYVATGEELKPFVQEALDAIEYVVGDVSTPWGARRAKDGHPQPFKLTYVEVGNEENLGGGQATYTQRFEAFYDAIKGKYPNLQIISAMAGARLNTNLTRKPDVIDDHYYSNNLRQALQRSHLYDVGVYERGGPKIFIGEYALRTPTTGDTCNLTGGIGDAAFLTGMERNADVVIMTGYAPLLTNVNPAGTYPAAKQWNVDLIGYDALTSFGSPSYYVQKMFSENRGDVVLPVDMTQVPMMAPATSQPQGGRGGGPAGAVELVFVNATRDNASGDVILKLVNAENTPRPIEIDLQGVKSVGRSAAVTVLTGNPDDVNTVAEPTKVAPKKANINYAANKFMHELPANSVSVVRLKTK